MCTYSLDIIDSMSVLSANEQEIVESGQNVWRTLYVMFFCGSPWRLGSHIDMQIRLNTQCPVFNHGMFSVSLPHGKASAPGGREEDAVSGKHSLPTAEGLPTHSFLPMCRNICKCGWPASATAAVIVVSAKKAFVERELMPSTASRPTSGGRGRRRRCYLPGTSRAWIQPAPVGWGASCWLCEWTAPASSSPTA